MVITSVENNITSLPFGQQQATVISLKEHLENGLTTARNLFGYSECLHKNMAPFDILADGVSYIRILQRNDTDANRTVEEKSWRNVNDALNEIGTALKAGRTKQMTSKGLIKIPLKKRQIFGLPLTGLNEEERRASPLLLKVAKLQSGYVGIAVLFKTQNRDYTLIDNFFKQFPNVQEVNV